MGDDIVVFLGPTLSHEHAREWLDAHYAPPAEQGHVFDFVQRMHPRAIVLIDGAFVSVPSVRHKEILWALHQGIQVFGASSLGALRAAELAGCGMRGFGLIYRWFRATPLAGDDEVAVAMAPSELGAGALGNSLIDMRIAFNRAVRAGIISTDFRNRLVGLARSTHFLERSYAHVLALAECSPWASSVPVLETWLREHAVSQKRLDAIGLLQWLGTHGREVSFEHRKIPPFTVTEAFVYDIDAAGLDPACLVEGAKGVGAVT